MAQFFLSKFRIAFSARVFWDNIAINALAQVTFLLHFPIYHRTFRLDDSEISFPRIALDIVSSTKFICVAYVVPVLLMLVICIVMKIARRGKEVKGRAPGNLFATFLTGFILAHLLNQLTMNLFTTQVGRLRPDFLARCQPLVTASTTFTTVSAGVNSYTYYDGSVCTGDAYFIEQGRLSFPSGHASASFTGLTFLSLTLFSLLAPRISPTSGGSPFGNAVRFLVVTVLMLIAAYVAVTRIEQNVHNTSDVGIGALIGAVFAFGVWFMYLGPFAASSGSNNDPLLPVLARFDALDQNVSKIELLLGKQAHEEDIIKVE